MTRTWFSVIFHAAERGRLIRKGYRRFACQPLADVLA
jgi:hypothetical protein